MADAEAEKSVWVVQCCSSLVPVTQTPKFRKNGLANTPKTSDRWGKYRTDKWRLSQSISRTCADSQPTATSTHPQNLRPKPAHSRTEPQSTSISRKHRTLAKSIDAWTKSQPTHMFLDT
eukprot:1032182-Rhodomonas_salina.2